MIVTPVQAPTVEELERIPTLPITADDVLADAASLIERRGWCRKAWTKPDGRICIGMALTMAGRDVPRHVRAEAQFRVQRTIGTVQIPGWNDKPWRSKHEVLDVLRRA